MNAAGIGQFQDAIARMEALLDELVTAPRHRVAEHPTVPNTPGIYLCSEDGRPIYVGQSRKLRNRLKHHTGATRGHNQGSFAFNIAKRDAVVAGVDVKRFRSTLEADALFKPHFVSALLTPRPIAPRRTRRLRGPG
ncbi:MAG: hypothetical protein QOI73_3494 [Solirubrobacteraceae bacterium]|nr:hypothetical protein [Solirubrobacteraceae bacterium]